MTVSYSITGIFPLKMSLWEGDCTRPCPRDYVCPDKVKNKSLWPLTQEKSKKFSAFLFFSGHLISKTHFKLKWIKPYLKTTGLKITVLVVSLWWTAKTSLVNVKKNLHAGKTPALVLKKPSVHFLGCFNMGGKKKVVMSVKFDLNMSSVFFLQQHCWNTRVKASFNWCSAFRTANTSCIRLSTSGQRSKRGEHNDVSSVQSSSAALMPPCRRADGRREGGGRGRKREGMCNLQLFAMMTVANGSTLHSSTWCSCKNSHPSQALASGRDNALLCFAGTSCEVSCLSDRKLPVMFQSCTFAPPLQMKGCQIKKKKNQAFLVSSNSHYNYSW